jgi:hypothetical protein
MKFFMQLGYYFLHFVFITENVKKMEVKKAINRSL